MKTTLAQFALFVSVSFAAGDWPQFRGPSGNGVVNDPALPTTLEAQNIQWAIDLPGRGLSSPIIIGDRVFVTCSSGPKQDRLHVICFNAKDGTKRWERQFAATGRTMSHDKTAVAAPTPASDGERVFAIFSSNDLVCLDLEGNLIWLRGLTLDYPNASNSLGMSSSLAVTDGVLITMVENDSESFTAGLDVKTGVNRWKLDRPKMANWTSPVLLQSPGQPTLAILQSGKGISAVEPKTGRTLWQYTNGASTIPSSTVSDGVLFVPSHGTTALEPLRDGQPPKQLWRSAQLKPGTASAVVLNRRVFTLNEAGVLTAGDAADGTRLWQLRLKGPFSATPVATGSHLYCVNEKGLLQVVDTESSQGNVVSELDLKQTILSTPSISRGAVYVRSDGKLWKLGKS
ncbi:MAG TPA: PQQ-binding-like beta-propeller repeat protein [Methylomirabilota bacterium]|nr:PQQ-binding-like beta-propeller repeat protein [Methylomirabilota bacterium]